MKHLILFTLLALLSMGISYADIKHDVLSDRGKLGSNYYAYPAKNIKKQTKAPAGYTPFYISHYGRHGSRFHYSEDDWVFLNNVLLKADSAGALTDLGKSLLERTQKMTIEWHNRAGDLTQLGADQHRGIAIRMYKNFPQVFKGDANINAYASTSGRCIVSMAAFNEELRSQNPKIKLNVESSKRIMSFINEFSFDRAAKCTENGEWKQAYSSIWERYFKPEPMMKALFKNQDYVKKNVDPVSFIRKFYEITGSLQGIDNIDYNFNDIWTPDDWYGNWVLQNAWWYGVGGTSPLTNQCEVPSAKPILRNIIEEAEMAIAQNADKKTASKALRATLRFGHDTGVLPLASMLQVEGANAQVTNLNKLAEQWQDFNIIPMAANFQFIFYKSSKKDSQILVKVMLNENEVKLPIEENTAPYYSWEGFKKFYGPALQ